MNKTPCAFEKCDRMSTVRGLCGGHYQQQAKGLELKPLRYRNNGAECSYEHCGKQAKSQTLCSAHYRQKLEGKELSALRGKAGDKECSYETCGHPVRALGLCQGHYQQNRHGLGLRPLKGQHDHASRNALGEKLCLTCERWLPEQRFAVDRKRSDGLGHGCRGCQNERNRDLRYGLSPGRWEELLFLQEWLCAICSTELDAGKNTHVDHDHTCCPDRGRSCGKCVRGLLCGPCNMGLGHFNDDPDRMRQAAAYVERG